MKSIWAPRAVDSDSHSLFDEEYAERRRFETEWRLVLELGVAKLCTGKKKEVDLEAPMEPEVADALDALWTYHSMVYRLFAFYACLGGDIT